MTEARHASTLILLRDGQEGMEVFMGRRHLKSGFVGGAYVFPGGAVDPADEIDELLCAGRTHASASESLGVPHGGLAYWVAAVRECFEEAGILLAYGKDGSILDLRNAEVHRQYEQYRKALFAGEISIAELARREGLRLATDQIHYWAHWITPEGEPRRYDARFFLAIAPTRQDAAHDERELTDSAWITPRAALEKARSGEWDMILPTLRNLILLRDFPTTESAESAARAPRDIVAVLPRIVKDEKGTRILVPGEEDV